MKSKTLIAGIVISLAIHVALLLLPSNNACRAQAGKIEIGIVYLAEPSAPSPDNNIPRQPSQQSEEKTSVNSPDLSTNGQSAQSKSLDKKAVKPLTATKKAATIPHREIPLPDTLTDNSRRKTAGLDTSQKTIIPPTASTVITTPTASEPGLPAETPSDMPSAPGSVQMTRPSTSRQVESARPPRYHINPPPVYPSLALKRRWQGEVWLRVLVDKYGKVIDAQVENSSGHALLDDTALKTVRKWKFHPARQSGENVREAIRLPIRFELALS